MKKTVTFLMSAAVLAASFEIAQARTKHPTITGAGGERYPHRLVHKSKWQTLYDQSGNDSGVAIVSQNFESTFDAYDSQGADDFVVPPGANWRVHEVDVLGVYFQGYGPAISENVFFYRDSHGLPGKLVHQYLNVSGADDGSGSFVITLPIPAGAKLIPGHYWLSVQVNMDFNSGGEWGWEDQTSIEGFPAAWQNPGGGFANGCTKWNYQYVCFGLMPGAPTSTSVGGEVFSMKGKTKGG